MKKTVLFSMLLLFLFTACEYESGVSEAFTKYRFKDGVTSVYVPGWVIKLSAQWGDWDKNERELLQNIDKVEVITLEDSQVNTGTNLHREFYNAVSKNKRMEKLMTVRDDNEQVTVFGKMEEKSIKEMLILVGGNDNAIIYVKGNLRPELVSRFVNEHSEEGFLSFRN
ncbi:DUF4252 domain-containing protein [Mariniphaga sediminis]|uniref:DUF4252 domain-containing protein n=1 Tax=Mariniphaga sediminis TaxID=1628158 RepID=A0A399CW89_9BACT|nr:DUF4252 domain-containing protein [Mariniphaga sediminis]RIH63496.1 DUF4252 domain-containing protein [Mariniphaga sediminis]